MNRLEKIFLVLLYHTLISSNSEYEESSQSSLDFSVKMPQKMPSIVKSCGLVSAEAKPSFENSSMIGEAIAEVTNDSAP